jgi:hypothetical protein
VTDCFWTNDEGCWEPECSVAPPTNVIYTFGAAFGCPTWSPLGSGGGYTALTAYAGAESATTAEATEINVYGNPAGDAFNCTVYDWSVAGVNADLVPLGSLVSSYPVSHSFDPTDSTAVADLETFVESTIGSDLSSKIAVVTVQTDVGVVELPLYGTACC